MIFIYIYYMIFILVIDSLYKLIFKSIIMVYTYISYLIDITYILYVYNFDNTINI